jgi:hypothetical protein
MAMDALNQLRDLARQDDALQRALDRADTAAELQRIAEQRGLSLSAADAEEWFLNQAAMAAALSTEELDALSQGLSNPDRNTISDVQLEAVSGGQDLGGEALMGEAIVGEAGNMVGEAL